MSVNGHRKLFHSLTHGSVEIGFAMTESARNPRPFCHPLKAERRRSFRSRTENSVPSLRNQSPISCAYLRSITAILFKTTGKANLRHDDLESKG